MNDKWTDDLDQKMKGHTEIGPEGLWEDLEQKLFGEEKGKIIPLWSDTLQQEKKVKNGTSNIGGKRIIGIVASLVIFIIGGLELYKKTSNSSIEEDYKKEKESIVIDTDALKENSSSTYVVDGTDKEEGSGEGVQRSTANNATNLKYNTTELTNTSSRDLTEVLEMDIAKQPKYLSSNNGFIMANVEQVKEAFATQIVESKAIIQASLVENTDTSRSSGKNKRGFSLGLLSGNMSTNASQSQNGYASMVGSMKIESNNPDLHFTSKPLFDIYNANLDRDVNTKIDHKRPVRFGLSVYYQLGDRWGINSGITYTKLSSKLNSGSDEYKIISDQTLHYIGIPIQVNYNIWQKGKFSTYVNGGVHVEKSIAGTLETSYRIANEVEKGPKEHIHTKSIQTSVNMSLGMEYKLGGDVGLFFEPGVRYYFDDKSSLTNVYKDKPFNFNAQIGIRYSISNNKKNKHKAKDDTISE